MNDKNGPWNWLREKLSVEDFQRLSAQVADDVIRNRKEVESANASLVARTEQSCLESIADKIRNALHKYGYEEQEGDEGEEDIVRSLVAMVEERDEKSAEVVARTEVRWYAGWVSLVKHWGETEARSEEAHAVYQEEAHRRGDVRHPDAYADLSEPTKEWDRVLVRWVERKMEERHTFDADGSDWLTKHDAEVAAKAVESLKKALSDYMDQVEAGPDDCESATCGHGRVCASCQKVGEWYKRFHALLSPAPPAEEVKP